MEEQEIGLADYLSVIMKWKWLIIIGTLVCGVLAFAYTVIKQKPPQKFEARASLLVIPPTLKSDLYLSPFPISVYKELAKAQDLEQAIVDSLNLRDAMGRRLSLSMFGKALEAILPGGGPSTSMDLVVTSADTVAWPPVLVTNVWATLFVKENSGLNNREVMGSYETINRQYEIARKNLEEAEDRLNSFGDRHELAGLLTGFEARTAKLKEFQKAYVNNSLDLQKQTQSLRDVESQLRALENEDGIWLGSLELVGNSSKTVEILNEDQSRVLQMVEQTRDDFFEISGWIRDFQVTNDLNLMEQDLESKRKLLKSYFLELSRIRIDAEATDHILKELKKRNGEYPLQSRVSETLSGESYREVLSLRLGYNIFAPRRDNLETEAKSLKAEIDRLEVIHHQKQAEYDRKIREAEAVQDRYKALMGSYNKRRADADQLKLSISALRPTVSRRSELKQLQGEAQAHSARIASVELQQSRLTRDVKTAKSTYGKIADLLEKAKVAKAGQPSDLKIVARAVEAVPVPSEASRNIVSLALGVGLLVSVFLAFFLEYLEKANIRLKEGGQAIG